jgi:REP element-mobilizing transposase RayT
MRGLQRRTPQVQQELEHVYLPVNSPPTVATSRLVNSLKGVSNRQLRQELPDLRAHYWRAKRLWSGWYFAGPAGGARLHRAADHRPDSLTSGRLHHRLKTGALDR